jgi:hypothetical protein
MPYPVSRPAGAAEMLYVSHVVFLSRGAKESTQTGKKMAKTTWHAPDANLATAYQKKVVDMVNNASAQHCKIMLTKITKRAGNLSKSGIESALPIQKIVRLFT